MTRGGRGRSKRKSPLGDSGKQRAKGISGKGIGGEQIEGRHAVTELLVAGKRRVNEVLLVESGSNADFVEEIFALTEGTGSSVNLVSRDALMKVAQSEAPQGVVAFAEPLQEVEFEDLLSPQDGSVPFLLALDGVTDPHNLGALIRTAECAGISGIVVPTRRSASITATVAKAAAGALEHMPIATVSGIPSAMQMAQKAGVWNLGLHPEGKETIWNVSLATAPIMLILGAEGDGLARLTKDRCDALVTIPQYGTVASLNVSNAGAVACFAIANQRNSTS